MFDWQKSAYEKYQQNQIVYFIGTRATGKTLLAHYIACEEVKSGKKVCIYNAKKEWLIEANYKMIKRYDKNIAKLIDFKSFNTIKEVDIRDKIFGSEYDLVIFDEYSHYRYCNKKKQGLVEDAAKNYKKTKYIYIIYGESLSDDKNVCKFPSFVPSDKAGYHFGKYHNMIVDIMEEKQDNKSLLLNSSAEYPIYPSGS